MSRTYSDGARWNAPGQPGKFQVLVDGKPLAPTFGSVGADWHWQDGGSVEVTGLDFAAPHGRERFGGR